MPYGQEHSILFLKFVNYSCHLFISMPTLIDKGVNKNIIREVYF